MSKIAARDSYIALDDIDGSLYILSQKLNSIALSWTSESPDVSSFGTGTRERLGDGIMDWEISLDGFSSADSDEVLSDLLSGSTVLVFTPGGTTSGSIIYSCSAVLTEYSTNLGVADMAPITARLVACRNEPKRYLLLDTFGSNIVTGAVNGSYATDGINVRTDVDTNGKFSIANGVAVFATGAAVNDARRYPVQARTAGHVLHWRVTPSDTNGIINLGWDADTSGAITDYLSFAAAGIINIVANGGTAFAVGTYTAVPYEVIATMRGTGLFWHIKGGAFATWCYLASTALGTAAGYPTVGVGSATSVFTVGW